MSALDPREVRETVLRQSKRAGVGHIGSALSVVELLCVLHESVLRRDPRRPADRDRFVMSKGHAALALYAVLHHLGRIGADQLGTFCGDGSELGVHPDAVLPEIDFSTGSLGMGLGFAAGAFQPGAIRRSGRRAFALLSDGECNEGAVWEAAMFASHHRLGNLTAVIDDNRQQALGATAEVLDSGALAERWTAFGWDVHRVDGHSRSALQRVFAGLDWEGGRPHAVLARTVCGKGVSYMEGSVKWHYWPMDDREFAQALREVEAAP